MKQTILTFVSILTFLATTHVFADTPMIRIDGSSTVYPPCEAVAEEFQIEKRGKVHVTVGISGTGGGFKKFVRGEIDIANASRPIRPEELAQAKENGIEFIEIPICFDAITVIINPQNNWVDHLTVDELKKMWEPGAQSTIMKWSQIRKGFPNEDLLLFGAGADSGTFDYFTEAIVGKAKSSRGDFTASEDDNVLVQGVEGSKNALGFIPYAYYHPHREKLKAVPVLWEGHTKGPVHASLENVSRGTYMPLSRPLFMYVSRKSADRPEIKEFIEFYIDNAQELVAEVNYLPLNPGDYKLVLKRFKERVTGTVFGGEAQIGLSIEEILTKSEAAVKGHGHGKGEASKEGHEKEGKTTKE